MELDERESIENKSEHSQMAMQLDNLKIGLANACSDIDSINTRMSEFMESQSTKIQNFMEEMFRKLDNIRSAVTTKEDLMGALMARVGMLERRQSEWEKIERENANRNAEIHGVLKHISDILERAQPLQTRNDLEKIAKKVTAHAESINSLQDQPGKDALDKEKAKQEFLSKVRIAFISATASGIIAALIAVLNWYATHHSQP